MYPYVQQTAPANNSSMVMAVIIVIILVIGFLGWYALSTSSSTAPSSSTPSNPSSNTGGSSGNIQATPNMKICPVAAGGPNRHFIRIDDPCTQSQNGWTPAFGNINVFSNQIDGTKKYCISSARDQNPWRALITKNDSCNFSDSGWDSMNEFYAYDTEKPNTDKYCVMDAQGPHRMEIWKNDDCSPKYGWNFRTAFWAPK